MAPVDKNNNQDDGSSLLGVVIGVALVLLVGYILFSSNIFSRKEIAPAPVGSTAPREMTPEKTSPAPGTPASQ